MASLALVPAYYVLPLRYLKQLDDLLLYGCSEGGAGQHEDEQSDGSHYLI